MFIYKKYLQNISIILFLLVIVNCKKSTEPINDNSIIKIEQSLIHYTELPTEFDSTFYQHNTQWNNLFDTTSADSLATILSDSLPTITDMWYPQSTFICGIPVKTGSEVLIKLIRQDSTIVNYEFEPFFGFPFRCVEIWRHYIFIKENK